MNIHPYMPHVFNIKCCVCKCKTVKFSELVQVDKPREGQTQDIIFMSTDLGMQTGSVCVRAVSGNSKYPSHSAMNQLPRAARATSVIPGPG